MRKKFLSSVLLFHLLVFLIAFAVITKPPTPVLSATNHVVISEVLIGNSDDSDNEFVELYNPTGEDVDITGWRLTRKSGAGAQSNLVASLTGTVPANGFFLIAHPEFTTIGTTPDMTYSATSSAITASSTVLLYSDAGTTVVDKVGFGAVVDFETVALATASTGISYERKATTSSTSESMSGAESATGNGEDTDHNSNDFVTREIPQPQNVLSEGESPEVSPSPTSSVEPSPSTTPEPSQSPSASPEVSPSPEPSPTPTVSPTPEPTPTPVPTPSPSVSPSPEPSSSPTPTPEPSPSVSPSPSPSPTSLPSVSPSPVVSSTPTPSPAASPSPSSSPAPSVSPKPSPSPSSRIIFDGVLFQCRLTYRYVKFFRTTVRIPSFTCYSK